MNRRCRGRPAAGEQVEITALVTLVDVSLHPTSKDLLPENPLLNDLAGVE